MIWTKDDEKKLLKAVAKATSVPAAIEAVRLILPTKGITYDKVANKLKRLGKPTLAELVAPNAPPTPFEEVEMLREKDKVADLSSAKKGLVKELDELQKKFDIMSALTRTKAIKPVVAPRKVGGKQRNGTVVMLCSDWHVEEPVYPENVNGLNEYNLEIADRCIDRMADAFEWMLRDTRYDVRTGVVWLGGDLLSGYIHDELEEANFLSPIEAVLWLQTRLEKMLRKIAATTKLDRIIVPCNDGNHGRNTHKIRVSTRTSNSLEYLLYKNLASRMSDDKRFEFDVAESDWTFVDVYNQTLAFTHGDSFQYGGGVGGISIPIRRGVSRQFQHHPRKPSYVSMGHFHQRSDFGDIAVNGSMIGYSPYAQRIHAAPEKRCQSWFLIDETHGKALSAPIWL